MYEGKIHKLWMYIKATFSDPLYWTTNQTTEDEQQQLVNWYDKKSVSAGRTTCNIIFHLTACALLIIGIGWAVHEIIKHTNKSDEEIRIENENYIIGHTNIMKLDKCEYIVFHDKDYHQTAIAHKGNCSNPIHKDR